MTIAQTDINPRTIDKIRKLMALAHDGGATQHEADLALSMAQRIMAENNLTTAQVEARTGQTESRQKQETTGKAMYKWQRTLMDTVARVNFCHLQVAEKWTGKSWVKSGYELIGRESNVVASNNLFSYLLQTISRLTMDHVGGDKTQHLSRSAMSFREGMAAVLCERLQERHDTWVQEQSRKAREEKARSSHPASATSGALVVVMEDWAQTEDDLNNDHRRGVAPGTTAQERRNNRARWAAESAARKEQKAALVAQGVEAEVADMMVRGYSEEQARVYLKAQAKPETDSQRRRREAQDERYWQRQSDRRWREESRRDPGAYADGVSAGRTVGLDDQVSSTEKRQIS